MAPPALALNNSTCAAHSVAYEDTPPTPRTARAVWRSRLTTNGGPPLSLATMDMRVGVESAGPLSLGSGSGGRVRADALVAAPPPPPARRNAPAAANPAATVAAAAIRR